MRKPPRSIEEWLYYKLLDSKGFHRFVRAIHDKINGIDHMSRDPNYQYYNNNNNTNLINSFKPTHLQKFKAFRLLFYDEWRAIFGLQRHLHKHFKD